MRDPRRGFTLVEMMIVVAIIGILAAIAIPVAMDMMKTSKKNEGELFLDALKTAVKSKLADHGGFVVGSSALTPAESCCASARKDRKCEPDPSLWTSGDPDDPSIWDELSFKVDEANFFRYSYEGTSTEFTALAVADLDCDGNFMTYTLSGTYADGTPTFALSKPARAE